MSASLSRRWVLVALRVGGVGRFRAEGRARWPALPVASLWCKSALARRRGLCIRSLTGSRGSPSGSPEFIIEKAVSGYFH